MGNRAISDDWVLPVIQADPECYRPSLGHFARGGGMVGAPSFRVGPVQVILYALWEFVENNMRTV
jgi:hypothetical protein